MVLMLGMKERGIMADFEVLAQATGMLEVPLAKRGKTGEADFGGWGVGGSGVEWELRVWFGGMSSWKCHVMTPIPTWGRFCIPPSNPLTLAGSSTIRLNSDTIYPETAFSFHRPRTQSHETCPPPPPPPPLQMSISSSGCHLCF